MTSSPICGRCGKPFHPGETTSGVPLVCEECLQRGAADDADAGDASQVPSRPHLEKTVSRSTILPRPDLSAHAPGEMICRLEPVTLLYLELSPNLRFLLGHPAVDPPPRSFLEDLHEDDRALAREEFHQVCEYGERNDLSFRLGTKGRVWHYMRIYAQARYDTNARINHIRCNLKDVTDSVRAEQELSHRTEKLRLANERLRTINRKLEEAQSRLVHSEKLAALGTLAAGVAHEINNPLAYAMNNTAVINRDFSEIMRLLDAMDVSARGDTGPEADIAVLRTVLAEIDLPYLRESLPRLITSTQSGLLRVARIVEKLRAFARLNRDPEGDIDVNEAIDQSLIMVSESLARLSIKVERNLGELPTVRGTAIELNQVFFNLLCNSIEAIEEGAVREGVISIETRVDGPEIVVELCDNGPGIPQENLLRIFDPFFTTKPPGKGTGMGLSSCHGILSRHGGRIETESRPFERTCFRVRLPLPDAALPA